MPTRRGPCGDVMDYISSNSLVYWRLVPHGGDDRRERRRRRVVERGRQRRAARSRRSPARAPRARAGRRSGRAGRAARRPRPDWRRRHADRPCSAGGSAMPWPARPRRPRPDRRRGPSQIAAQTVERGAGPGRARRHDEGAALRGRLQLPLARGRERRGQFGDLAQRGIVLGRRRAIGMGEQDAVAAPTPCAACLRARRAASPASVTSPASTAHSSPWNRRRRRPERTATARSSAARSPCSLSA